jgi:hypothetical protein
VEVALKKILWAGIFRLAYQVIVPSSVGVALMHSLGIPPEWIMLTPFVVDSPYYCKERFPIQVNWPDAAGTLFEGCSLGPPGRISAASWKPWSELFHEAEERERSPKIQDKLAFFRAHTLFSNAKINPAWRRQIQLRSQRFLP